MRSINFKVSLLNSILALALAIGIGFFIAKSTSAEQSGSSPESGATSRFKTVYDEVTSLGYGSTSAGAWGDWGPMWNTIYSAAIAPVGGADLSDMFNGGNTDYPQAVGGIEDYNNNTTIPADTYKVTWTTCDSGNNYCGTGTSAAVKQDPNTGLVWSARLTTSNSSLPANTVNWFVANNCMYPNDLEGNGDGVCSSTTNPSGYLQACKCVKLTGSEGNGAKTGCEDYNDGGWRLPYQKELMQAYIDGVWGSGLDALTVNYWSATTLSTTTQNAWNTFLYIGYTAYNTKTNTNSVRCVRL